MASKKDGEKPKFDLSQLDTSKASEIGAVLEVLHPVDNTPLGIKITLAGADSDIYRRFMAKIANKARQRIKPGRPYTPPTQEEDRENAVNLLVACTLGWEGIIMRGEEYPFSPENARVLYSDPGFSWLYDQVDGFIQDRANFLSR